MFFKNPAFFYAFFALIIPIIIHLFNLQRTKKVAFTRVHFLENIKKSTSNKFLLKQWLILASRLLFLSFLVLAFARPSLHPEGSSPEKKSPTAYAVYLDNTYSMQQSEEDVANLDVGLSFTNTLLNKIPESANVMAMNDAPDSYNPFFESPNAAREHVAGWDYTIQNKQLNQITDQLSFAFQQAEIGEGEVFMISDFQKATKGELEAFKPDSSLQYHLIPVKTNVHPNVYVDSVWLENPFIGLEESITVNVRLKNSGNADAKASLELAVNSAIKSNTSLELNKEQSETKQFDVPMKERGWLACEIRLNDYPITFDNQYFFTIQKPARINVAIIEFDTQQGSVFVQKAFEQESLFNVVTYNANDVDFSKLVQQDLVVLQNYAPEMQSSAAIAGYLKENNLSTVVFPHSKGWGQPDDHFGLTSMDTSSVSKTAIDAIGKDVSLFQGVFDSDEKQKNLPKVHPVVRTQRPGKKLLSLKDGHIFLLLANNPGSSASSYLFTSPLNDAFSGFHRHALFVPVLYKIAVSSASRETALAHALDEDYIQLPDVYGSNEELVRLRKGEEELVPEQQREKDHFIIKTDNASMSPGIYDVLLGDTVVSKLALNMPEKESYMQFHEQDELNAFAQNHENVDIETLNNIPEVEAYFASYSDGKSLWQYCLILSLAFLFVEILFIRLL